MAYTSPSKVYVTQQSIFLSCFALVRIIIQVVYLCKKSFISSKSIFGFFGTFVFKVISSQHEWKRDCKRLRDENFPPLKRDLSLIYLIEYYTVCTIIVSRKRAVIETMQLI